MKYFKKRRSNIRSKGFGAQAFSDNDPMTGVANLFDIGLVFIVGLIVTLFTAYHLQDLFTGYQGDGHLLRHNSLWI